MTWLRTEIEKETMALFQYRGQRRIFHVWDKQNKNKNVMLKTKTNIGYTQTEILIIDVNRCLYFIVVILFHDLYFST